MLHVHQLKLAPLSKKATIVFKYLHAPFKKRKIWARADDALKHSYKEFEKIWRHGLTSSFVKNDWRNGIIVHHKCKFCFLTIRFLNFDAIRYKQEN